MGSVYAGHHPVIGKRVAVKVLAPHCASHPRSGPPVRGGGAGGQQDRAPEHHRHLLVRARWRTRGRSSSWSSSTGRAWRSGWTPAIDDRRRDAARSCGRSAARSRRRTGPGIIHRDLKPENVWIATPAHEDSFAKVLDFGIAKLLDDARRARARRRARRWGRRATCRPSSAWGARSTTAADIYSLGIILYEMFAGVVPFRGETFGELIYQQMSETPEPPSKHRPMEPELERLILMCLEKDPAKRPESAKELARLLDVALQDGERPITQPRTAALTAQAAPVPITTMSQSVGQVVVTAPPAQSRKRAGLVVGATALVVVVGGAVLSRSRSEPPAPAPSPVAAPASVATAPAQPATGRLQLRLEGGPADKVSLDGREIARTTSAVDFGEVALGAHFVTIEAAGREPQNTPVTVAPGAPTVLSVVLKPAEQPQPPPHGPSAGRPRTGRPRDIRRRPPNRRGRPRHPMLPHPSNEPAPRSTDSWTRIRSANPDASRLHRRLRSNRVVTGGDRRARADGAAPPRPARRPPNGSTAACASSIRGRSRARSSSSSGPTS